MPPDARAWLVELHRDTDCPHAYNPCADCLADAILSAPGVEVEVDRIKRLAKEEFDERAPEIRNPRAPVRITHTQVVIRLPAQPIEEGT